MFIALTQGRPLPSPTLATQIAPAGQAVLGGVRIGDSIVSLNQQPLTLYDQIMAKLPQLPRPLVVGFRKRMEGIGSSPEVAKAQRVRWVGLGGHVVRVLSSSSRGMW